MSREPGDQRDLAWRIVAVLCSDEPACSAALKELSDHFGPVARRGDPVAFDVTTYYEPEMGPGLTRRIVAFAGFVEPDVLASDKKRCLDVERRLAIAGRRVVNLDSGILDAHKLVLASTKHAGHKLYVGRGIYADTQLLFSHGRFGPLPWTFPDFRDGRYDADLLDLRRRLLAETRGA